MDAALPSVVVLAGAANVSRTAAEIVVNRLRARTRLRLLLPTGHTPLGMYAALREHAAGGVLPGAGATAFALDEYRGPAADDPRSYRAYLARELGPLGFGARHALDGDADDPAAECARYQRLLDEAPIDLAVLGLGRDGHVAFDEPGSLLEEGVHEVALNPVTRLDAAEAFGGLEHVPERALTVGLRTLHAAREVLLLVTGTTKAGALRAALEEVPSRDCPASLLRSHPRLTVLCDRAAAAELRRTPGWDSERAAIVLGHRADASTKARISDESLDRLRQAERLVRTHPVRAVVLTGYTATDGLSEAEQMRAAWTVPDAPTLLEVAGRSTAENASCSLPLVLALGGIRRVTVVTSMWHVRAPFFFAPYRQAGLSVGYRLAHRQGWRREHLAEELRGVRSMRSARAAAMAATRLPPALAEAS